MRQKTLPQRSQVSDMKSSLSSKEVLFIFAVVAGSVFAGFINGLLGTGAGTILIFIYSLLYGGRKGYSSKDSFASAMTAVLPISVFSLLTYRIPDVFDFSLLYSLILPAAAGGILGAYLSGKVKAVFLKKLFAVLVIYAGFNMLFK